jgi:CheY-like chemotaxis protein
VQKEQAQRQLAVPGSKDGKSGGPLPTAALVGGLLAALVGGMLLGRRSKAARATPPLVGAEIDLRPTILICDDDPDIRLLYREVMEATGAVVLEAADGRDCLRLADSVQPDLVLLDLILPGLSGLDVLTELRQLHPLTPVVIMSGALSGEQRERSLELGAAESVEKLDLVARIPALVDRYRQRDD